MKFWMLSGWNWHVVRKASGYIIQAKLVTFNSCWQQTFSKGFRSMSLCCKSVLEELQKASPTGVECSWQGSYFPCTATNQLLTSELVVLGTLNMQWRKAGIFRYCQLRNQTCCLVQSRVSQRPKLPISLWVTIWETEMISSNTDIWFDDMSLVNKAISSPQLWRNEET